ncbi:amino acid ABC transporter permease [Galactobacter valiniphilus]|uniref:amino acid ABC transporter permease n=1 Tax=Galactobacter valiniphilus TaxID=2676122 RepID=UPI0037355A82
MSAQQSVLFDAPGPKTKRTILIINVIGAAVLLFVLYLLFKGLGDAGELKPEKWNVFAQGSIWSDYLLPGLMNTLKAAAISIVLALVFGFVFGLGRLSHMTWVRVISSIVVEFFRAVPVLIMMIFFWLFLGGAQLVPPDQSPFVAVVLGLTFYNGSVIAELVRSGVEGLPKGQREAGIAIGLTRGQSLRSIEVPQALTAMLPALIGQFVIILKDSALGSIVTYNELLYSANLVGTGNGNVFQALVVAAAIFIVINYALSALAKWLSRYLASRGEAGAAGHNDGGAEVPPAPVIGAPQTL